MRGIAENEGDRIAGNIFILKKKTKQKSFKHCLESKFYLKIFF